MARKTPARTRTDMALIVTILIGLGLGFLIKRVHVGLLLGLAIGLTASAMMRNR